MKNVFKIIKKKLIIKKEKGLSERSEQFERVASFEIIPGQLLCGCQVKSLLQELFSEDPSCFVRLGFEAEGFDAESEDQGRDHQDEGSDELREIPLWSFCHALGLKHVVSLCRVLSRFP